MLKKMLLLTAALGFSGAALATPPHWAPAHGWRAHYQHYRPYYVAPRPIYVVPAPRVVYAAPPRPVVYYAAPAPVYGPAPVYPASGISIRLHLPL